MFNIKFDISRNADFSHVFSWLDANGAPIIMTGSTLKMHVKKKLSDNQPVLEMTTANGLAVIDILDPYKFTLTFPRNSLLHTTEDAEGYDRNDPYVFDLIQILPTDDWIKIAQGTITVRRGATS